MQRNVLTIATGKQLYIDMAVNLARSFFLWHPVTSIKFYLVTDHPEYIPADLKDKVIIKNVKPGELGEGFTPKLSLDKVSPEGETLFIDSDCLVFGKLDSVFDRFKGNSVSVVGDYISEGEWFGDIKAVCTKFGITHLPKFNGGVYYLEKGSVASAVYETARKLEKDYDAIGFTRLRNRPNDEVLMALAMELHQQKPIPEDGSIMGEFVNFQSGFSGDVYSGKAVLLNKPGHPKYQAGWKLQVGKPLIVHFLGEHTTIYPYTAFAKQLQYSFTSGLPLALIKALTFSSIGLPWYVKHYSKEVFRPLYRKVFGVRKIQKSDRIVD